MKTALFAVVGLLALSFVPVSGYAQMPGEKCGGADKVQVGTTKIATDSQNIIACLLTGNTAPGANVSEWKAMTSSNNGGGGSSGGGSSGGGGSGGGGITGGCEYSVDLAYNSRDVATGYKVKMVYEVWGQGCDRSSVGKNIVFNDHYGSSCSPVAAPGYACGLSRMDQVSLSAASGLDNGYTPSGTTACICVKQ